MSKSIKAPNINLGKKIKEPNIQNGFVSHDSLKPTFSFENAQKNYCLSEWSKSEIKHLIEKLKVFENETWQEIKLKKLFQYSKVNKSGLKTKIPTTLTSDVDIYYFKPFGQNTSQRIFGYREGHHFKFLWFDKNHEVYPG